MRCLIFIATVLRFFFSVSYICFSITAYNNFLFRESDLCLSLLWPLVTFGRPDSFRSSIYLLSNPVLSKNHFFILSEPITETACDFDFIVSVLKNNLWSKIFRLQFAELSCWPCISIYSHFKLDENHEYHQSLLFSFIFRFIVHLFSCIYIAFYYWVYR